MIRRIAAGSLVLLGAIVLVLSVTALFGAVKPDSLRIGGETPANVSATVEATGAGASLASAVESDFKANESVADSAPQQSVVAGWATKDALQGLLRQSDVLTEQNAELSVQMAETANALTSRIDSVIALLAAIALAAVAGSLVLTGIAVVTLRTRADAPITATSASSGVNSGGTMD